MLTNPSWPLNRAGVTHPRRKASSDEGIACCAAFGPVMVREALSSGGV